MSVTKKLQFSFYSVLAAGIDNDFFKKRIGPLFGGEPKSPAQAQDIGSLIVQVVTVLLLVAASVAVIFLIIGGYRYVMAHGSEEGTEAAKKTLSGAVLGLIVIILSFAIVRIISAVLLGGALGLGI